MQKINILKAVSRNLGDLIVDSTLASLTGSTVDILKLIHPAAEQLIGKDFYIYSGAGAGQQRTTGSFNPTNRRLIFTEVFGSVPSINSNVLLFNHFTKDEYDNAIERVIGWAQLKYLEDKVATLALVGTQYEYAVPSGFEYINNLQLVPSGWNDYRADSDTANIYDLPPRYWRIDPNPLGTFVIKIDPRKIDMQSLDDHWANVVGQVKPDIAATDNAVIPVDIEEYVIAGACSLLASQRIGETREWTNKFRLFTDRITELEAYIVRSPRGRRVS